MTKRLVATKTQRLNVMLSDRRMGKLQRLALQKDKTMTQVIEELLDGAPEPTCDSAVHAQRIHPTQDRT